MSVIAFGMLPSALYAVAILHRGGGFSSRLPPTRQQKEWQRGSEAYLQVTPPSSASSTSSTATYRPRTKLFRTGASGCSTRSEITWNLRGPGGVVASGAGEGELSRVRRRPRKSRLEVGKGVWSAGPRGQQDRKETSGS